MKKFAKLFLTAIILTFVLFLGFYAVTHINVSGRYNKEKILKRGNYEKLTEKKGKKYDRYTVPGEHVKPADYLTFSVYKSALSAKKAFKNYKEKAFREIEAEGDDYVQGWLDGVMDASIREYAVLKGNMIIYAEITVISEWPMSEDANPGEGVWDDEELKKQITDLMNNW